MPGNIMKIFFLKPFFKRLVEKPILPAASNIAEQPGILKWNFLRISIITNNFMAAVV